MGRKIMRAGVAFLSIISLLPVQAFAQNQQGSAPAPAQSAAQTGHAGRVPSPVQPRTVRHEIGLFRGAKMVSEHRRPIQAGDNSRAVADKFSSHRSVAAERQANAEPAGCDFAGAGK